MRPLGKRCGSAPATCEYCQLTEEYSVIPFEMDHIIARHHEGTTAASNLALACFYGATGQGAAQLVKLTSCYANRKLFCPRHLG
jgi:hypothetical protein